MSGPFRKNVFVAANHSAAFNPPVDGLRVLAPSSASITMTINGVSVAVPAANLAVGHFDVGGISAVSAHSSFSYLALREGNYVTTDTLTDEGGD